jgi:O-antigen/teichoic acid export membrane protein
VPAERATRVVGSILVVRFVALAINLAGAIALARALGPDLRGAQALFTTGAFVLALLLTVGANTGGYLLVTRGGGEPARIGVTALAHGVVAGLLVLGAALIVRPAPGSPLGSVPGWPVPLALAVAGLVVNSHQVLLALARGRGLLGAALSVVPYVSAAVAYVAAAAAGKLVLGTAVWSFAISPVVAVVVAGWPRTRLGVIVAASPSASTALAMVQAGIRGALTDLVTLLHQRIDVLLLGALAPLASTGAYVVAYQSAEPLWAMLSAGAVAALAAEPAARQHSPDDDTALIIRQTALLAGLMLLAGALVLPHLLPLLYGEAYEAATVPLLLLLPGVAAYAVGRVASSHLVRNALLGRNVRLTGLAFACNVVMNLALIPLLGAVGAALASLCSYTVYAALALTAYTRTSATRWPELVPRRSDVTAALDLLRALRRMWRATDRSDGTNGRI